MSRLIKKIAVLGGGSFGTVIASLAANNGANVNLYVRSSDNADSINKTHINSKYLPDFVLPNNVTAFNSIQSVVNDADLIFIAVPSKFCREVMEDAAQYIKSGALLVSTTKGIEMNTFKLMSQVVKEILPASPVAVLSGPNLAKQIAKNEFAGAVVAGDNQDLLDTVCAVLRSSTFRVYMGSDVYGVELGGALKNIYAIIFGMAKQVGIGENTQALLLTRSLAEMSRFAVSMGANPLTFIGLAGVGDLFATCMSPLSRNYRVGQRLAMGQDLNDVVRELGQVAEGVNTLAQVKMMADQNNIYMPLVNALYDVIFNEKQMSEVVAAMTSSVESKDVEFVITP